MTAEEFIKKWRSALNITNGLRTVGIHVKWEKIPLTSKVIVLTDKKAWDSIYNFCPPWGLTEGKSFKDWFKAQPSSYTKEIKRETDNGKIDHYRKNGLKYPYFPIFADETGLKGVVADGNHRFLDCDFLIKQRQNFTDDIEKCTVDIICLPNLQDVLQKEILPK